MISDITLGQFFPGFSVLHRLDPRTKLILATLFIVAIFLASNPLAFLLLTLFTVFLILISRISWKVILKGIKPLIYIAIFTALISVFLTPGEGEPLVAFWVIHIYTEGIVRAVLMTLRFLVLVVGTSMFLTYTTSPIALTGGLESLLYPLKKLHIPVHIFSLLMTIALRFIPTLVEETEKLMNAQKSRGADFTSGGLFKRAKALIPLLIPLILSGFQRAEELATAMECRCYRVDKERTKMTSLRYRPADFVWMAGAILLLAATVWLRSAEPEGDSLLRTVLFYRV